jgi:hypothetical protein
MGFIAIPALFHFAHFRKVNELGHPGKHNATKPNNAWWRWIRSGQRNAPVIAKTADMRCDRLFKIAHFQNRPLLFSNWVTVVGQASTHRPVPS